MDMERWTRRHGPGDMDISIEDMETIKPKSFIT
jgi:hypothetical protein